MVEIESIRVLGIDSDDLTHDLLTVKQSANFHGCPRENIDNAIQAGQWTASSMRTTPISTTCSRVRL